MLSQVEITSAMAMRPPTAPLVFPEVFLTGLVREIAQLSATAAASADAGQSDEADRLWTEAEMMSRQLAALRPLPNGQPPSRGSQKLDQRQR